jgi:KTSC domain-containing protein
MDSITLPTSTTIERVDYDEAQQSLDVWLRNGSAYRYIDVPRTVFTEMVEAPSAGRYFVDHVRERYSVERLREKRT